ncbi:MAG: anion permease, partial [Bacteroidaceae bacterium]|nr:anion permease [Bacteroidaceae bacterium]
MNNAALEEEKRGEGLRKLVGAVAGPLCAVLIWLMPIDGLAEPAHHLLAVMSLVAIWWVTEPVPIPVTSLLGPTLCVLLGIASADDAYSRF